MHEAGHELAGLGVVVVVDALDERRGAVAGADDGDAHLPAWLLVSVGRGLIGHAYPSERSCRLTYMMRWMTVNAVSTARTYMPYGSDPCPANGQHRRDEHDPLGPRHEPRLAPHPERLRLGARVAHEERADERHEDASQRDLVALIREHDRDRAQDQPLRQAVGGRVEEPAERRQLAVRAGQRAVEDVEDRARDEDHRGPHEVALDHEHGRRAVHREAGDGDLVRRERQRAEAAHEGHAEVAAALRVPGLQPGERGAHPAHYTTGAISRRPGAARARAACGSAPSAAASGGSARSATRSTARPPPAGRRGSRRARSGWPSR